MPTLSLPTVTGYVADAREQVSNSNRHMVEQAARLYLTNWEMESGGADSATITAAELVQQGYLSALPEGEDYNVTITKTDMIAKGIQHTSVLLRQLL